MLLTTTAHPRLLGDGVDANGCSNHAGQNNHRTHTMLIRRHMPLKLTSSSCRSPASSDRSPSPLFPMFRPVYVPFFGVTRLPCHCSVSTSTPGCLAAFKDPCINRHCCSESRHRGQLRCLRRGNEKAKGSQAKGKLHCFGWFKMALVQNQALSKCLLEQSWS